MKKDIEVGIKSENLIESNKQTGRNINRQTNRFKQSYRQIDRQTNGPKNKLILIKLIRNSGSTAVVKKSYNHSQ